MKSVRLRSVTSMVLFCLLALQVHPAAQEQEQNSVAKWINDRDGIVVFSETATPDPLVETAAKLSPVKLSFGSVTIGTTSSSQTVTLTNTGAGTLSITEIAIAGTNRLDFHQYHTCSNRLAPGASCSINVTFKPTGSGTRTAALNISDDGDISLQTVPLAGTGVAPSCIPLGKACFGPGPTRCCAAPFPHHSFCSSQTGWGVCLMN